MDLALPSELKLARKQAGLTQGYLSELSGVPQSVIAKIENAQVDPAFSTVRKLFAALESRHKNVTLVREVMHSPPVVVNSRDVLATASAKMKKFGVSQLPIVSRGAVVGFISEENILAAIEKHSNVKKVSVREFASPSPPSVSDSTPASALPPILHHSPIVCVMRGNKLVGVVTRSDLLTVF